MLAPRERNVTRILIAVLAVHVRKEIASARHRAHPDYHVKQTPNASAEPAAPLEEKAKVLSASVSAHLECAIPPMTAAPVEIALEAAVSAKVRKKYIGSIE